MKLFEPHKTFIYREMFLLIKASNAVYNQNRNTIMEKTMKFLKGAAFTVLICLVMSVPVFAADSEVFTDVERDVWYYDEVMTAYDRGIMVGMSDSEFAPDKTVTREMFVTALSRIAMTSVESYHEPTSVFSDVTTDKWYSDAIEWAASGGIVYGITKSEFGVGRPVTREQIAAFAARFINTYLYDIPDVSEPAPEFTDKCSDYAKDSIELMRKTGIISGKSAAEFAPTDNATRAEVAAILLRLHDAIREPAFSLSFDSGSISQMGVFCEVYTKDIIITESKDIEKFVKFLNETPIERAEFIGHTTGWDHKIALYDNGGKKIFTLYFTASYFIVNECLYTVEGDYFQPIVDAVK